ncbi:Uncharacterized conserved protein, MAPEG superfamily [Jannaschia faecimaris]|uniref:Uncharacterized conserved protein, MAPEG superfamily n=1 Tax=Jannaschia faecimaris TaxID=1244108 RepID=A0A1H3PSA1_9RHOB|nr:MAPEG family protein [Jannaschia faecimaris]SDZ03987.1 Uncharacterized conserved protein, MAPEG superfamily [Jannaschia faecimaris]
MDAFFAPYAHTLASLGGWAILMLVLLFLSAKGKPRRRTESGHPVRDYSDPYYRRSRAFLNAIEITGPFVAASVAAVLVGAAPFLVNLFASVFVISRVATATAHIATENQPLRSIFWVIGLICCLALSGLAIAGAFAL